MNHVTDSTDRQAEHGKVLREIDSQQNAFADERRRLSEVVEASEGILLLKIETLEAQQLAVAQAYDPNCDYYIYEDELAKMEAARQIVESMQELAVYLGRNPEYSLTDIADSAMGVMNSHKADWEAVEEALDGCGAPDQSSVLHRIEWLTSELKRLRDGVAITCHQCGDVVPADDLPQIYCVNCKED